MSDVMQRVWLALTVVVCTAMAGVWLIGCRSTPVDHSVQPPPWTAFPVPVHPPEAK